MLLCRNAVYREIASSTFHSQTSRSWLLTPHLPLLGQKYIMDYLPSAKSCLTEGRWCAGESRSVEGWGIPLNKNSVQKPTNPSFKVSKSQISKVSKFKNPSFKVSNSQISKVARVQMFACFIQFHVFLQSTNHSVLSINMDYTSKISKKLFAESSGLFGSRVFLNVRNYRFTKL